MKEKNPEINFNNADSKEEVYFYWWIQDLIKHNVINVFYYKPKTFLLFDDVFLKFSRILTKKTKEDQFHLTSRMEYTPDFAIIWNDKNKLHACIDEEVFSNLSPNNKFPFFSHLQKGFYVSYIDVKGLFAGPHNNAAITFPLKKVVMYNVHGIYVCKTEIPTLFKKTFTPDRFTLTDITMTPRKINYHIKNVSQYISDP